MNRMSNSVNLIGNLGTDPQIKSIKNGTTMARFSVATNNRYKNGHGKMINDAQWHNIVAWGKTAEIVEKYLKKGSKVVIDGRLNHRQYETSGGKKNYITEIIINEMIMM